MPDGRNLSRDARPWFRARRERDAFQADGSSHVDLGHHIARPEPPDDGAYASWHWDGRELVVTNDRLGLYPLYYSVTDDQVAVSPSIGVLLDLGIPRALDEDALAAFLGVGFYLGDDTPFRSVRAMPPAGRLVWSAGGWSVEGGPHWFRTQPITRRAVIEGFIDRFRVAVSRRLRDEDGCVMPVSGGRDSRNILLELIRQGHPPRLCVTAHKYPHEGDTDAAPAARLCAELGIRHRILDRPYALVSAEWRKNELTSYGADEHAWFLRVREAVEGEAYTYEGLGGGTCLERPQSQRPAPRGLVDAGRLEEAAARMIKTEGGAHRYLDLLTPSARTSLSPERAAARIHRELQRHTGSDEPLFAYFTWNRAMRELTLAPGALLSVVPTVFMPFMDRDVIDFLTSVPSTLVDYDLHNEALAVAYPHVAHVPLAPKGRSGWTDDKSFLRRVNLDLLRLSRRSTGELVDRPALMRRAARGLLRGDDWVARGRSATLATYLVQLETLAGLQDT